MNEIEELRMRLYHANERAERLERVTRERDEARARVAELESLETHTAMQCWKDTEELRATLARARGIAAHAATMLRAVLAKNANLPGFAVLEDLDWLAALSSTPAAPAKEGTDT